MVHWRPSNHGGKITDLIVTSYIIWWHQLLKCTRNVEFDSLANHLIA